MNDLKQFEPIRFRRLLYNSLIVALILLPLLSFLACYISPHQVVFFQWLGLLLPIFMAMNVLLLLFGIIRRRWYGIYAAIALLFTGIQYCPRVWQLNSKKVAAQTPDIKLATFNVRQFKMMYNVPSIQNIAEFIDEYKVNTLCLQEIPMDYSVSMLQKAFPSMSYCVLTTDPKGGHNLAILSKYPIYNSQTISFDERPNCALAADILVKRDTLRIFNCHLQTTSWNQLNPIVFSDSGGMMKWLNAVSVISDNFKYRANQTNELRALIDRSSYSTLVCGDFNDPPISYTYNTMKGELKDAFCEAGNGYSYTYRYFMKLFRIDFVFFSDTQLQVLDYQTADIDYSDHLPILVDFKFGKDNI